MRSPFPRSKQAGPVSSAPPERRRKRTTQDMLAENRGPGTVVTAARTLLGFAVAFALLAAVFFGAQAIEGDDPAPLAPWNDRGAPSVAPAGLHDQ